jgi:hypothetical protein
MIYHSYLHVGFAPLDCGWLCVSLSVQNAKRGITIGTLQYIVAFTDVKFLLYIIS